MNYGESLELGYRYQKALQVLSEEHPTAKMQGKNECCRSCVCCWRAPGELDEEDVRRLSKHFGMSEQDFFKEYCVVDIYNNKTILRLRRKHQEGGRMLSARETYSISTPCIFLDGNSCSVHDIKPNECAQYQCWVGDTADMPEWNHERLKELGWDGVNPDDVSEEEE